jgi:hypothetical protein
MKRIQLYRSKDKKKEYGTDTEFYGRGSLIDSTIIRSDDMKWFAFWAPVRHEKFEMGAITY